MRHNSTLQTAFFHIAVLPLKDNANKKWANIYYILGEIIFSVYSSKWCIWKWIMIAVRRVHFEKFPLIISYKIGITVGGNSFIEPFDPMIFCILFIFNDYLSNLMLVIAIFFSKKQKSHNFQSQQRIFYCKNATNVNGWFGRLNFDDWMKSYLWIFFPF